MASVARTCITFVLLSTCTFVHGSPDTFTGKNCKGTNVCWLPMGSTVTIMGASASAGTAITFDPQLVGEKYAPGQTYTLGMSGKSGKRLVGATQGTWASESCTCGTTTTGAATGTWTAPGAGSGSLTIGMTYATGPGSPVYTTVTDYAEAGSAPASTTLPPTKAPTQQPTRAPTQQPTSRPTTTPTQRPSTSSPTTSTPTVSPTIDCVCLGLVGGDDAYCGGAYDGATLVSKQQCEADARCKFGPQAGEESALYPECSLLSQAPSSSSPSLSPTTSTPTTSPVIAPTEAPQPSLSTTETTTNLAPTPTPATITFNGYITDTICLVKVNSVDFQNITTDAPKHTRACLLLDYCIASGYTLLDYDDATQAYSAKYQIASADETKVVDMLNRLSCKNNISVTVSGTVLGAASFTNADYVGDSEFWFTQGRNESFGDIFQIESMSGMCGGDISLEDEDSDLLSLSSDDVKLTVGAVVSVVAVIVIAVMIIFAFERFGLKYDTRANPSAALVNYEDDDNNNDNNDKATTKVKSVENFDWSDTTV